MLASVAKPVFVTACACNLAFSIFGAIEIEAQHLVLHPLTLIGGGLSFAVAAALGLFILQEKAGMERGWIKAALVFLVLGPLAFWSLQWPAATDTLCIDVRPYCGETLASHMRTLADIVQSQMAMIAVALAATFCAARAMAAMLDDLAV
jgi:hypothetical protein